MAKSTATYTKVRNTDGTVTSVNDDYLKAYLTEKGGNTDLEAPLDPNKLPSNSIYRPENAGLIGSARVPNISNQVPQYDVMAEIENARNARYASRQTALASLRNRTKSSLKAEKATIAPMYYDKRNDESSSSQIRARKLTELMAAKGYSEGANAQAEISSNVALQGNLGSLKRQEQGAYDDIARRETDAETAYQEGLAQAEADADTFAAEQRLNEIGTQRSYDRQDAETARADERYNENLDYNRTEQAHKDWENSLTTSTYPDVQAEINRIVNNNDSTDDWQLDALRKIRAQKIQELKDIDDAKAKATAAQDKLDYDRAWDKWTKNAPLSAREYQILGITPGTRYVPPKAPSSGGGGNTPDLKLW